MTAEHDGPAEGDRSRLFADRYELLKQLGEGGSAVVYRARDTTLGREVAIKLLPGIVGDAAVEMWLEEARLLAKVEHPNVVAVYDAGQTPRGLYFALQLVLGFHLRQWLVLASPSWQDVLEVLMAAGRGLAAIHDAGIEHRDFKPENVLLGVDREGYVVRVGDFGIARLLDRAPPDELKFRGTQPYMAPERVIVGEGEADDAGSDVRADIYSFCVTLWEAIHGCPPYDGETAEELRLAWAAGKLRVMFPRPDVPKKLVEILRVGLAMHPSERYATMEDLLDELATVPNVALRKRENGRVRGLTAAALAGLASTVVLALVLASRDGGEADGERAVVSVADASTGAEADESAGESSRAEKLAALHEFVRTEPPHRLWGQIELFEEHAPLMPEDWIDIVVTMYWRAKTLRNRERVVVIEVGVQAAKQAGWKARSIGDEELRNVADSLRECLEAIESDDCETLVKSLNRDNPRSRPR